MTRFGRKNVPKRKKTFLTKKHTLIYSIGSCLTKLTTIQFVAILCHGALSKNSKEFTTQPKSHDWKWNHVPENKKHVCHQEFLNWSMIDKFDPSSIWEQSIARCPEQKFTWVHNEAKMKKIGMKAGAREPKIIKLSNFCFSDRTRHNQFSVLLIAKLLISFVISFSWVRLVPKLYSTHVLCYNKSAVLELVVTTDSSNDH